MYAQSLPSSALSCDRIFLCPTIRTMQAAAAAVNQGFVDFGGYIAASLRRRGILSAVQGQHTGGIVDADALDRIAIVGLAVTDLSPGLYDTLEELNNVPVDGEYPIPPQQTLAQQRIRELSREVRVSDFTQRLKSMNKFKLLCSLGRLA